MVKFDHRNDPALFDTFPNPFISASGLVCDPASLPSIDGDLIQFNHIRNPESAPAGCAGVLSVSLYRVGYVLGSDVAAAAGAAEIIE